MAPAFAPKVSQVLMTPEPHYLPGTPPGLAFATSGAEEWDKALGWDFCNGGFIPRAQNHFAKTYGEICKQAWLDFVPHLEQGARGQGQAWEAIGGPRLEARPLPGSAAAAAAAAAAPPAFQHPGSPLALERCSPQATFVSGFTGFVPRIQFLIGGSYPILAHQAMAESDQMLRKTGRDSSRRGEALPALAKTYPLDRGLLPHYRGYVPGYKFQFGHTYGHLTRDALGLTTLEKQGLDVTQ
ncbi:protein FAM166B [Python bivittatus]|uniref:Ciliary microtubule inner protein 2B n=1 Tax=Python bivittatus TaxID=176946 RepID=A0A9F5JBS6_PYTBI|nr:protein FAM166B [Python bivittatus]